MTYPFLMYMKVVPLSLISLLAGCASGGPPEILVSTRTVDASQAFALPPPGGPSIVSVIERPYNNAVQQEILLATSARTPGQNVLRVQFFGPVKANLAGGEKLRDSQLGTTDVWRELRGTLPGVAMQRSPNYVQNRYGPFGYATGRSRSGDTCIYAWQRIRPGESKSRWLTGRGSIQVRLRLCDSGLTEHQLLAFMYAYSVNAAFNDYSWNPYGDAPGPAENLGKSGENVYPSGPSVPPTAALMPSPEPERQAPPRQVRRTSVTQAAPPSPAALAKPVRRQPTGPLVPPPPGVRGTSTTRQTPDSVLTVPAGNATAPSAAGTPIVPPPSATGQQQP
ncbi:cellulose biosynthesis protein BcsN [Phyllobacterium endophyticum]|uniref:cellulose biosynthesis protein BcsN n=1 Tax=Phyllobacterium endophyticum TaxID=1149773 RepID=UPI0011CACACB|nr:cellulose biosynthesis protein BcsN [Phyllobacterium endophyticum]TXR46816.1 cellulose biosynthesis protein BcsN [Phyllobacterium endophyticum]